MLVKSEIFFCLCLQNAGIINMFHKAQQKLFILNCYLNHWSAYAIYTVLIKSFSKTRVRIEEWNQNPGRLFNPILQCSAGGAEYPWALSDCYSLISCLVSSLVRTAFRVTCFRKWTWLGNKYYPQQTISCLWQTSERDVRLIRDAKRRFLNWNNLD